MEKAGVRFSVVGGRARGDKGSAARLAARVRADAKPALIWARIGSAWTEKRTTFQIRRHVGPWFFAKRTHSERNGRWTVAFSFSSSAY